jgi:hypothetical protein
MADLEALHDTVLPLVGLINNAGLGANCQTTQFISLHQIRLVEDFNLLEPQHPGKRFGQPVKLTMPCLKYGGAQFK